MAISERIRCIRKKRGLTQRQLGMALGLSYRDAGVRISQYESGTQMPRREIIEKMAAGLEVSPKALNVPDIDGTTELMHMLFALEDRYGFQICRSGSHIYLVLNNENHEDPELQEALHTWSSYAEMVQGGKMNKWEYDDWRYNLSLKSDKKQQKHYKRSGMGKKEKAKEAHVKQLWEWLRKQDFDLTLDEVRDLHERNWSWHVEKTYVVVINYKDHISPVRHIVEVQEPYDPDAFKDWYYAEYHKLDGDEFIYCQSHAHMFACVKAAQKRGAVYENKNEACSS